MRRNNEQLGSGDRLMRMFGSRILRLVWAKVANPVDHGRCTVRKNICLDQKSP